LYNKEINFIIVYIYVNNISYKFKISDVIIKMNTEFSIQYTIVALSILMLIIKRKGMKRYIPLGLFVIIYSNILCFTGEHFHWWTYPNKLAPYAAFNYIIIPIFIMFWMRYCPVNVYYKVAWILGWSLAAVIGEFLLSRFTLMIKYSNGFGLHISLVLWIISFSIFSSYTS
jgi:hypothetical protein